MSKSTCQKSQNIKTEDEGGSQVRTQGKKWTQRTSGNTSRQVQGTSAGSPRQVQSVSEAAATSPSPRLHSPQTSTAGSSTMVKRSSSPQLARRLSADGSRSSSPKIYPQALSVVCSKQPPRTRPSTAPVYRIGATKTPSQTNTALVTPGSTGMFRAVQQAVQGGGGKMEVTTTQAAMVRKTAKVSVLIHQLMLMVCFCILCPR